MIVFAGPSVPAATRVHHPAIDWRPPAEAGDLLALLNERPEKVLLIDGLFDERASVKHKEAMALMAAGTRLYGATSMGALRAAELHGEGMIPLGAIANAYLSGLLVGDDEVALVHGDARIHWKAVSVAMVDVRATLVHAVRERVVTPDEARRLRQCWHDIHYVDRDWPVMIEMQDIVPSQKAEIIARLAVPLKQRDAAHAIALALAHRDHQTAVAPPQTLFFDRLAEDA